MGFSRRGALQTKARAEERWGRLRAAKAQGDHQYDHEERVCCNNIVQESDKDYTDKYKEVDWFDLFVFADDRNIKYDKDDIEPLIEYIEDTLKYPMRPAADGSIDVGVPKNAKARQVAVHT